MAYQTIICRKEEPIAFLFLHRPQQGNTINPQMARELMEACQELNDDERIHVVILSGDGEAFCQGVELPPSGEETLLLTMKRNIEVAVMAIETVASLAQPVIAAINGDALAEGLELALACDIRIVSQSAKLGLLQTSWGLIPTAGGTQRLPRIVGRGKALEMLLTAEAIDASESYRVGLVNKVVKPPEVMPEADVIAKNISSKGPLALRYAKEAALKGPDMTLIQGLGLEADLSILLHTTQDRAEGISAFLEKRTPRFTGK
ncbi:MAG: enoyl-CoA hydratase/isomerase family protein [Chloroflexi bacterium]|nr:enoyl-CoA hydratase/isomerase family protein [Chloroflexota bacterium]